MKGVEIKTLEPSNPGILEPYFHINIYAGYTIASAEFEKSHFASVLEYFFTFYTITGHYIKELKFYHAVVSLLQ